MLWISYFRVGVMHFSFLMVSWLEKVPCWNMGTAQHSKKAVNVNAWKSSIIQIQPKLSIISMSPYLGSLCAYKFKLKLYSILMQVGWKHLHGEEHRVYTWTFNTTFLIQNISTKIWNRVARQIAPNILKSL